MKASILSDRLDFTLPDFTRIIWTSDLARNTWAPRIQKIQSAWENLEWLAVVKGLRLCSLTRVHAYDLPKFGEKMARNGLSILPLGLEGLTTDSYSATPKPFEPNKPFAFPVVIGLLDDIIEFQEAWISNNHLMIGKKLGFPDCCCAFFKKYWIEDKLIDTTWPMALASLGHTTTNTKNKHLIEIEKNSIATPLFRWIGIRLVPHLPCSVECIHSKELANKFVKLGNENGFVQEMDWALEILSWDIEWDALHGIAELRLPIAKIIARTDATANRYQVRIKGSNRPQEIASGLRFPYKNGTQGKLTKSKSFQAGLKNTSVIKERLPESQIYTDNGFSNFHGMRHAHTPIIEAIHQSLNDIPGIVLDLGAGNGFLIQSVCTGTNLLPAGIEIDSEKVRRSHNKFPELRTRLIHGNLFDLDCWPVKEQISGTILMIGRLLEVERQQADLLLNYLARISKVTILYTYSPSKYANMIETLQSLGIASNTNIVSTNPTFVGILKSPQVM